MLKDTYFRIEKQQTENSTTSFEVTMLPTHPVYQGHFPGKPVSPGVCNMQMLKECAETVAGKSLLLNYVKQYRLLEVITPQKYPHLQITMQLATDDNTHYTMQATVAAGDTQCIDFKGELTANE